MRRPDETPVPAVLGKIPWAIPVYRLWMALARAMGFLVSRAALVLTYYGVLCPIAFAFKARGRDALRLKRAAPETYWTDHPRIEDPSSYDHLF